MTGWILGLGIPAAWIVCWLWSTRIWYDRQLRNWTWSFKPDGFEFGMTLFVCAFTAPVALIAGLVADGVGGIPGWFAPTLAAEERAKAARERRRAEARQIRAAAQDQPSEVREALLLAARSLEEEQ